MQLTEEQKKDIQDRVDSANSYLKENNLVAAVQSVSCNLGAVDQKFNGIFGTYLQVYLQDTKFAPKKSDNTEVNPAIKDELVKEV